VVLFFTTIVAAEAFTVGAAIMPARGTVPAGAALGAPALASLPPAGSTFFSGFFTVRDEVVDFTEVAFEEAVPTRECAPDDPPLFA
jgi:hypothetical protein